MKILLKLVKVILFSVVVGAGIGLLIWWWNAPQDFDPQSRSAQRLEQAPFKVETVSITFTDSSRATPALGKFSGSDVRVLKGSVWFPKTKKGQQDQLYKQGQKGQQRQTFPLLISSHGFGSYHQGLRHLHEYLASQGYIVAAVDFPLSNLRSLAGSPQLTDVINQPGDVSALIDYMLSLNTDSSSEFYQRIDSQKIGAYGLSLGGLTTALATLHPDYRDQRIKTAVMMAPPLHSFTDRFYAAGTAQSLIFSGSHDRVVPEPDNATQVQSRHPDGWFLSIKGGSHLGFANVSNPIRWMENPDSLGCAMMDRMLAELELPERWSDVIPNTDAILIDEGAPPPCPEIPGKAMNGLKQQWLTRLAVGAFFDMHLREGEIAEQAKDYFTGALIVENPELSLLAPR